MSNFDGGLGRESDLQARADRRAVYAVAIGDRFGLEDGALRRLRDAAERSVEGLPSLDGIESEILAAAIAFDSAVWPESGPIGTEEEAVQRILDAAKTPIAREVAEALSDVRRVIQPTSRSGP